MPVVVDTMENKVWKSYGSAPNCAYVIDRSGKIVESEPWMEPAKLRRGDHPGTARSPVMKTV